MKIVEYEAREALRLVGNTLFLSREALKKFLNKEMGIEGARLKCIVDQVILARPHVIPTFVFTGNIKMETQHWVKAFKMVKNKNYENK